MNRSPTIKRKRCCQIEGCWIQKGRLSALEVKSHRGASVTAGPTEGLSTCWTAGRFAPTIAIDPRNSKIFFNAEL